MSWSGIQENTQNSRAGLLADNDIISDVPNTLQKYLLLQSGVLENRMAPALLHKDNGLSPGSLKIVRNCNAF
jgi:hypothetical protein